jgi:hypothetical protein
MKKDNLIKSRPSDCSITINIENTGDINIYNCSNIKEDKDYECTDSSQESSTTGFCVPTTTGAKPKQSKQAKLDRLLANNPAPSAFAASFIHTGKRFLAGKTAGSELESKMFKKFRELSPRMKKIFKCTVNSFNSLSSNHKKLFNGSLMQDINKPVDADSLATAFGQEIKGIISNLALGNKETPLEERPGKVRLDKWEGGEEIIPAQVHIFTINALRTSDYIPNLAKQDYLPEEFQQTCTPILNGDKVEWDCSMQQPPCDGNSIDDACLRVQQIQGGTSVTLEGVNFCDVNAKVKYKLRDSADDYSEVDAFVYGDVDTPVTEIINSVETIIADNRVHDKIFFTIPQTTLSGIYEFMVAVPNTSGFTAYGDTLFSDKQYLEVIPPSTARFQIASEQLWARDETGLTNFGSDEVGIKINSIPIFTDLISMGEMQQNSFRFDDVDSQETRPMESVLFSQSQPISGVILSVIGFEIDGEDAYQNQITEWTDVFWDLFKEQWKYIAANAVLAAILQGLTKLGFWGYLIIGIAAAITVSVDLFVALWAPADLIIQDTLGFSVTDLVRMTNINIPAPVADADKTLYTTPGEIDVRLMFSSKIQYQYTEQRGYLSSAEDSWYNITFRYNRLV